MAAARRVPHRTHRSDLQAHNAQAITPNVIPISLPRSKNDMKGVVNTARAARKMHRYSVLSGVSISQSGYRKIAPDKR
jgi:hypothetical protein